MEIKWELQLTSGVSAGVEDGSGLGSAVGMRVGSTLGSGGSGVGSGVGAKQLTQRFSYLVSPNQKRSVSFVSTAAFPHKRRTYHNILSSLCEAESTSMSPSPSRSIPNTDCAKSAAV